ncbi:hypothetical protein SSS_09920 [Sarcoptes scabiei]|nr:hypothetical protein SSS_09920 [Sarcoptes scabiei]
MNQMEQPNIDQIDNLDEQDDFSEMPSLEEIENDASDAKTATEMNTAKKNEKIKKNIIIPEDDTTSKQTSSDSDDQDQENDGYMDILNNGDLKKKTVKSGKHHNDHQEEVRWSFVLRPEYLPRIKMKKSVQERSSKRKHSTVSFLI